ncbi:MAG: 2,3,4,5-tetrahydropyridine-2,6-dicarboxylate N-succinyltransferase [Gammaproteobacteria bacterium]|nr:MAG: 2,3,4,5-tetrahydropyridine-2,6-dicarboxylate N-succinyltransferase [Gammaproteobacteria bacterium]
MSNTSLAFGLGVGTINQQGQWLEVFFPTPVLNPGEAVQNAVSNLPLGEHLSEAQLAGLATQLSAAEEAELAAQTEALASSGRPVTAVLQNIADAPDSVPAAYMKLHLLSHRLVKPHGANLDGIFALLPNVAWTNEGAIDLAELPQRQLAARLRGAVLDVACVDKFPKMTNYVVPKGVRIAHTARVRLGAYLGEGTTIMHEGFVNFNAGTEGTSMVEGRISAGVFVGEGSDLGGGCSTMGTLSGGGDIVIALGKGCLLGANAGVGIPLGDQCTVEAGLYLTAGTKVTLIDTEGRAAGEIKARELAGKSELLFRRNSRNGAVECLTNNSAIALNDILHAHN